MKKTFKIIGFDADDTLWVNESYFRETEKLFYNLLSDLQSPEVIEKVLYKIEMQNLSLYGYGIKGFMLSMIETALRISNHTLQQPVIDKIIALGKEMLDKPVVLLDGVQEILEKLTQSGYKLIVATKGDLLDQERKLSKSNLEQYFHHIEVMSDKKEANYQKLLAHLDIAPEDFLMVGNSLKSDIMPVLNIGGYGIHIPYHTTWIHEEAGKTGHLDNFWEIGRISDIEHILDLQNN